MDAAQNIALFKETLLCGHPVYTWQYDADFRLLETNCPESTIFAETFDLFGCKATLMAHAQKSTMPIVLGSPVGLMWAAALQKKEDVLQRAVVLGPVLTTQADMRGMEQALRKFTDGQKVSLAWRGQLTKAVGALSVVQINLFLQYALMLHCCLTGEHLRNSDLQFQETRVERPQTDSSTTDRHRTWMAEQALLRAVREGDLNYRTAFDNASGVSTGIRMENTDALRQAKNSSIVFVSLCVRAAIDGGLSPEQAYSLGDTYIQSIETSETISDVASFGYSMYTDFINQVHNKRVNLEVSPQIRAACEYIELHTEEPFTTADVAQRVGYAEYYLSRKFKAEMGVTITNYIKFARMERAKLLLTATDLPVLDIAVRLQFCTRSYFSKIFSEVVGCTPVEYRNGNKRF